MVVNQGGERQRRPIPIRTASAAALTLAAVAAMPAGAAAAGADSVAVQTELTTPTLAEIAKMDPGKLLAECSPALRATLERYMTQKDGIDEIAIFGN
ncbi:hypothetical protein AB0B25_31780 [Nocardia sp. NPDC049190]|uniref:hypothetical protein n=1 Tax=Nocardia sp. NPDC049190 TaxID=3155650 RepID=UPI0033E93896